MIIKRKIFSKAISEEDRGKLKKLDKISKASGFGVGAANLTAAGLHIRNLVKDADTVSKPAWALQLGSLGLYAAEEAARQSKVKEMYKKYHPEDKNPSHKDIVNWVKEVRKEK